MEKMTLIPMTRKTESGFMVSRESVYDKYEGWALCYRLDGGGKGTDINHIVYEMMQLAALDVLDMSTPFGGEYTAAELAGRICSTVPLVDVFTNPDYEKYERVCFEAGTSKYHFPARDVFVMLAEWESMMGISQKKAYRFRCDGREQPKDTEVKVYKCSRGYRPRRPVMVDPDQERIAMKYAVLGAMVQILTDEGMKRAMSVLTAVKSIEEMFGYEMGKLAGEMLRRKLWRDYGKDKYQQPMCYTAKDFDYAPEMWLQVDMDYAKELTGYFRQVLAENPAPKWPAKGDMVQMKEGYRAIKKWQGKLCVYEVRGSLDPYKDKINWYATVCTTKGKYDSTTFNVDMLEPWTEPEKPASKRGKNDARIGSSERKQARSKIKPAKAGAEKSNTTGKAKREKRSVENESQADTKAVAAKEAKVFTMSAPKKPETNAEPTLEERLRAALLKQLRMAA